MRYLFILAILSLLSCSPDRDLRQGEPEISFDLNGTHYAHTGVPDIGGYGASAVKAPGNLVFVTYYSFTGYTNLQNIAVIIIPTPNDTLKTIRYRITEGMGFAIDADNKTHGIFGSDYVDIDITGYRDGVVNGSFNGVLSEIVSINPPVTRPALLTNGKIKDVRVRF